MGAAIALLVICGLIGLALGPVLVLAWMATPRAPR